MKKSTSSDDALYANSAYALFRDLVVEGKRAAWTPDGRTVASNSPDGSLGSTRDITPAGVRGAPGLESGAPLLDALWNLALADVNANVNERGVLEAGAVYTEYEWVRDTAFSLLLGYDMIAPRVSRRCLENLVDPESGIVKLEQYEARWESWPYKMTDSAIWVPAVLRYAEVSGDTAFLRRMYRYAAATLDRFRRDDFDASDGLYLGNSSFFDGHNGYPMGYSGRGLLKTLSSNCAHYAALRDAARIADAVGRPDAEVHRWQGEACLLAEAIRREFWDADLGYPVQIKLGAATWERRFEALGAALYLLFGLADEAEARSILSHAPATPWGVPTTWPDYEDRVPYHTGSVWPFVAGLWGIAAARYGDRDRLAEALASVARIAALELTFVELLYDGNGRRMGSDRQLWSACGYLGLVIQGLLGIVPRHDGFLVQPCVPNSFPREIAVTGLKLGRGTVDVCVTGRGTRLGTLRVNGEAVDPSRPVPLPTRAGKLRIEARLAGVSKRGRWIAPPVAEPDARVELRPASLFVRPGEGQDARFRVLARFEAGDDARKGRLHARWSGGRARWRVEPAEIECVLAPGHQAWFEFQFDPVDVREVVSENLKLMVTFGTWECAERLPIRREFDLMSEWLFIPRDDDRFAKIALREKDPMPYWDPAHVDADAWRRLRVPMPIETRIPWIGKHRVGWYRRHLHLPKGWKGRDLRLLLGRIHGAHRVYVNGRALGAGRATRGDRVAEFIVPAARVKFGASNVIAVRVRLGDAPRGIHGGPVRIEPAATPRGA